MEQLISLRFIRLYTLLLCAGFFLWPVSLGIPSGTPRLLWVLCAFIALLVSVYMAKQALQGAAPHTTNERFPYWLFIAAILPALVIGSRMPIVFFGDEETIALPTLTVLSLIAHSTGWLLLAAGAVAATVAAVFFMRSFPVRWLPAFVICTAGIAAVIAFLVTRTETEFVRYPPLVHLAQAFVTALTGGNPVLFRLASVLWWFVCGWVSWTFTPQWSPYARFLLFLSLGLTPLGWTYRILLYQAAGEIVCATALSLLVGMLWEQQDRSARGGWMGMICGLWIAYRPTALAPTLALCVLLMVLGYRRAAWDIAWIALPIGCLWVLVYVMGSFQYDFLQPGGGRTWTWASIALPIRETLRMLPAQLHPLGIIVMIAGGIWLTIRERTRALPLFAAWYLACVNTGVHQVLTTERWYGYGRFNSLLILPLAFTVALLWGKTLLRRIATVILVLLFIAVTPWDIATFLQTMRSAPATHVERTVTGGVEPTPLPAAVDELLQRGVTPAVILGPSHAFLDLFIARGLLTAEQRTAIRQRSDAWVPGNPDRPVVILAPIDPIHYLGNIDPQQQARLQQAAEWALTQSTVRAVWFGAERALIVE